MGTSLGHHGVPRAASAGTGGELQLERLLACISLYSCFCWGCLLAGCWPTPLPTSPAPALLSPLHCPCSHPGSLPGTFSVSCPCLTDTIPAHCPDPLSSFLFLFFSYSPSWVLPEMHCPPTPRTFLKSPLPIPWLLLPPLYFFLSLVAPLPVSTLAQPSQGSPARALARGGIRPKPLGLCPLRSMR